MMARGRRKGKAVMGMNKDMIRQALGRNMYDGDLGAVSVKELIQNAVDTVRPFQDGTILVDVDPPNKTIHVSDNGLGMSPSVAENEFLDIGGTYKPTADASGGFGLAKIAYFSMAERIDVETVWKDPRGRHLLTTITGSGDDWIDESLGLDIDTRVLTKAEVAARTQQYGRATGTSTTIKMLPDARFRSGEGYDTALEFMQNYADQTQLPFTFDFRNQGAPLEGKRDYSAPSGRAPLRRPASARPALAVTVPFQGGTFDVYLSTKTKRTQFPKPQIMNNGQPQFNLGNIYLDEELPLPDEIVINIKSAAKPDEDDYPFTTNRQQLRGEAKAAVEDYIKNRLAGDIATAENAMYREAITKAPRVKGSRFTVVNTSGYDDAVVAQVVDGSLNPGNPSPANWRDPVVPASPERGRKLTTGLLRELEKGFKDVQAVLVAQNPVYANAIFTGWGLGKRYYAVNVKTEGFLGAGSPRHIMLNPHALYTTAESRARTAVENAGGNWWSLDQKAQRALLAEKLAAHMAGDLIHELTHNEAWGHDDDYASALTYNAGANASTLVPVLRRLHKLLTENDGELLRQLEAERDALSASGPTRDEDIFAKIGSAQRAADAARAARSGAGGEPGGAATGAGVDLTGRRPEPAGGLAPGRGGEGPGGGRPGGAQRGDVAAGPGRGPGDRGPGAGAQPAGGDQGAAAGVPGRGRGRPEPVRAANGEPAGGLEPGAGLDGGGPVRSIVAESGGAGAGAGPGGAPGRGGPGGPGAGPGGPGGLPPVRRPGQPGRGATPAGPSVLPGGGSPTAAPRGAPARGGPGGPGAGGPGGPAQPPGGAAPGGAGGQPGKTSGATSWAKLAQLFSLKGLLRQGLGAAAGLAWQPVERTGAAILATPERMRGGTDLPTLREAGAMWGSYASPGNWGAALSAARHPGQATRLRQAMGAPATPTTRWEKALDAGYNVLGVFDRLARSMAESAERAAQTARGGVSQADIDARAGAAGDYRTLTQDLDLIGEKIDGLRDIPGGQLVIPYWQIPYNGMKYDLERSPLGVVSVARGVVQRRRGEIDATEFYERATRAMAGSAIAYFLFNQFLAGNITGPQPSAQAEKDAWRAEGKEPFAARIGGRWVPMSMIPGVNAPLIQAAAVADFVQRHDAEGRGWDLEEYQRLVNRSLTSTIHAVANRPFFDGIYGFMESMQKGDEQGEKGLLGWGTEVGAGFAVPGAIRDLAKATDDVERAPRGQAERVMAGIPGLSGLVPERRDAFGNVRRRTGSGVERYLNPMLGTQETPELGQRRFNVSGSAMEDTVIQRAIDAVDRDAQMRARGVIPAPHDAPTQRQRLLAGTHARASTEGANTRWTERRRQERLRKERENATRPSAAAALVGR